MYCYIIIIIMFFCRKCGFTNNYVKDNIHRKATGGETHENVSNVFTKFTNGEELNEEDLEGVQGKQLSRDDRFDNMNKKDQRKFMSAIKNVDKGFFAEDSTESDYGNIAHHICRSCNFSEPIKTGTVIYTRRYGSETGTSEMEDYSHLIHSNILPRSKNYECKNPKCETHNDINLREAVITKNSKDRTVYVCCVCQMAFFPVRV